MELQLLLMLLLLVVDLRDFLAPLSAEIEVEEGLWWRGRWRWRESGHCDLELFTPVGCCCDCFLPAAAAAALNP